MKIDARKTAAAREIVLRNRLAEVRLQPADGVLVRSFKSRTRRGDVDWLAQPHGCFPLLPFGSRIENGEFTFDGTAVALPANNAPERHAIHGHAFQRVWSVQQLSESEVTLSYDHTPGEWPWRYRAICRVRLRAGGLELSLTLRNLASKRMPFGLGWHPYFRLSTGAELRTEISGCWRLDEALIGRGFDAEPGRLTLQPASQPLDAAFGGWSGRAELVCPAWRASMRLEASGADTFVVYSPEDADFVCLEPLSNAPNGFNLAPQRLRAYRVLEPGENACQMLRLLPQIG